MLGFMMYRDIHVEPVVHGASAADVQLAADEVERALSRKIEGLELACAGLWELLKRNHGYTEQQLIDAIREVDMRDGKADGKIKPTEETCPKCGRKLLTKRKTNCSWCGAQIERAPF